MILKSIILMILGFIAGSAVSAGTFAFLLVIGVVPRILRTAKLTDKTILAESVITIGTIVGCIMSLWERQPTAQPDPLWAFTGHILIGIYGLSAGTFVGCISISLAEILHTFPILFRRFSLTKGLEWLIMAMAFGKFCGALFSFCGGYWF